MAVAGVLYPLKVIYCGVCGVPPEFCEYGAEKERCKDWLKDTHPDEYETRAVTDGMGNLDIDEKEGKKRQTRGGKAIRAVKKKESGIRKVVVTKESRSKKKFVTIVAGLRTFEVDLKKASKLFSNKFSCGASITGDDEIVIQGDVSDDVIDLIQNTWPEIDEDSIDDKT